MKFWKIVQKLIEQWLPDWRDKFLAYKALKKQLKLMFPDPTDYADGGTNDTCKLDPDRSMGVENGPNSREEGEATKEVVDFVKLLDGEIDKFNVFFMEKEEEYIIRWELLQDEVAEAEVSGDRLQLMKVRQEILDFHGEMILLENYSALNYIGLGKILKKYDKRSGKSIRLQFIQKVLQQPFFSTDVLNTLVNECGTTLDRLFFSNTDQSGNDESVSSETGVERKEQVFPSTVPEEILEIKQIESKFFELIQSALKVLKEIRGRSSTVNPFSLPPMQD